MLRALVPSLHVMSCHIIIIVSDSGVISPVFKCTVFWGVFLYRDRYVLTKEWYVTSVQYSTCACTERSSSPYLITGGL